MPNVNDILQIRTCAYANNQISLNVLHFLVLTKVGTGATLSQIATSFDTAVAAVYKGWMAATATYRGVGVRVLFPVPTLEVASVANAGIGTGGANMMPTQVSGLIGYGTAIPGRRGRGRIFPGFPAAAWGSAAGELTGAGLTALQAVAAAIPFSFTSGGGGNTNTLTLALYHRSLHTVDPITLSTARVNWATQRRRGDFGRTNALPF